MIRQEIRDPALPFSYVLYRPENRMPNLPLIVQLHGAGEAGNGQEELEVVDRYGFSRLLRSGGEYPCLAVMPQCGAESFWAAEIPNVYTFIRRIMEIYRVDPNRVYLTGISMGGYGTWLTASRYPKLFAAIAPVCGGGMVWKAPVLKMPVWAFHGTEDDLVYPSESENMVAKIRQQADCHSNVRLTMLPGVGHNAWDYTFDEELLNWLLSHSK